MQFFHRGADLYSVGGISVLIERGPNMQGTKIELSGRETQICTRVLWDNHGCMPLRPDARFLPQLERYRAGGVSVVSLNVGFGNMSALEHLHILSFMRYWISQHSDKYQLVRHIDDVYRCRSEDKLGITFDIEGMNPVFGYLCFVQTFYELGVRWMLIAYNRNNKAGGGCLDDDIGLTPIGKEIVDEMERVGMVLCLSHTGQRTAAEAMEYSRNPVIFSHSNPYSDNPHPRNVSDALMKACAKSGGVVGLSGIRPFLGESESLVEKLVKQISYVIDLIGPDHVGIGLDYVFDRSELEELRRANPSLFSPRQSGSGNGDNVSPESMLEIADRLGRMNLTESQIRGILGENWMRIAKQVWK